jgi:hypothetical protein
VLAELFKGIDDRFYGLPDFLNIVGVFLFQCVRMPSFRINFVVDMFWVISRLMLSQKELERVKVKRSPYKGWFFLT